MKKPSPFNNNTLTILSIILIKQEHNMFWDKWDIPTTKIRANYFLMER
jgi:hypothetical protein